MLSPVAFLLKSRCCAGDLSAAACISSWQAVSQRRSLRICSYPGECLSQSTASLNRRRKERLRTELRMHCSGVGITAWRLGATMITPSCVSAVHQSYAAWALKSPQRSFLCRRRPLCLSNKAGIRCDLCQERRWCLRRYFHSCLLLQ